MFIPVCIHVLSQQNRRQLSYCKGALCINSKFSKVNTKFCKTNIFIDKTLINCLSGTFLDMIREHWKDGWFFFFVYLKRIHVHVCNKAYRHYATLSTRKLRENSVRSTGSVRLKKNPIYYTLYQKVQCNKWIQNLKNPNRKIKWWISVLISLPFFCCFFFFEGEKTRVEWHINQLCVCGIIITFRDF